MNMHRRPTWRASCTAPATSSSRRCRRASRAAAVRRLERRAARLSHRAERVSRRAERAASQARLAVARAALRPRHARDAGTSNARTRTPGSTTSPGSGMSGAAARLSWSRGDLLLLRHRRRGRRPRRSRGPPRSRTASRGGTATTARAPTCGRWRASWTPSGGEREDGRRGAVAVPSRHDLSRLGHGRTAPGPVVGGTPAGVVEVPGRLRRRARVRRGRGSRTRPLRPVGGRRPDAGSPRPTRSRCSCTWPLPRRRRRGPHRRRRVTSRVPVQRSAGSRSVGAAVTHRREVRSTALVASAVQSADGRWRTSTRCRRRRGCTLHAGGRHQAVG